MSMLSLEWVGGVEHGSRGDECRCVGEMDVGGCGEIEMVVCEMLCRVCFSVPLGLLPHREENTATEGCTQPRSCLSTVVMGHSS